jgi:hypothetical protein
MARPIPPAGQPVPPGALRLQRIGFRKAFGEADHEPEHVLGHGAVEHAARIGENHVALDERRKQHGVHTRPGPVHPAQPLRLAPDRRQTLGREIPAEQHLRLWQSRAQRVYIGRKVQAGLVGNGGDAGQHLGTSGALNSDCTAFFHGVGPIGCHPPHRSYYRVRCGCTRDSALPDTPIPGHSPNRTPVC